MKLINRSILCTVFLFAFVFAFNGRIVDNEPCAVLYGDEVIHTKSLIPYLGILTGPGDQIGTTAYDYQANGSFGQRLDVDDYDQAHIDWMWQDYPGQTTRYCAWNARFADGSYYGETQACPSYTGYVQLDITRDANPDNQRSVIVYHEFGAPNYMSWVDIDGGNVWGAWPSNPHTVNVNNAVWPKVCVANNNNIVIATGDYAGDIHHLFTSTDAGVSWTEMATFDSCATLSQHVRASEYSGSDKVVFAHTQFKEDSTAAAAQLDCDVFYTLSTDGGATWGSQVNITNYSDSVRAYCNVNAVFDDNDNLHIAWAGRRVDASGYYEASKIFHWDEVTGNIHTVSSPSIYYSEPGGWWIATASSGSPGAWRMPADQPQLIVDHSNGDLYCLWHGNDDYDDSSAGGFFNGEFYGSKSTDGGVTWSNYVDLTNTRTPGAGAGACDDEDYMTACPKIVNDSIFLTYVEDKDAGGFAQSEGSLTQNPVRCWVFPKTMVGVAEHGDDVPQSRAVSLAPNPATDATSLSLTTTCTGFVTIELYDASGRFIEQLDKSYRTSGVHCVRINTETLTNGTYFCVVETPDECFTNTLVVVH